MFYITNGNNGNSYGGYIIMWTKIRVLVLSILCVCMCGCKGVPTKRYTHEDVPKYKVVNRYYNVVYYLDYETLRYEITWADPKSNVIKEWLVYVTFIKPSQNSYYEYNNVLFECDYKDYYILTK